MRVGRYTDTWRILTLRTEPVLISDDNLSHAWAKAFCFVLRPGRSSQRPMLISIGGFQNDLPQENVDLRQKLDETLRQQGKYSTLVSAGVIFPYKEWERAGRPHYKIFFSWYLQNFLPRLRARNTINRNGTYFERMIAFKGVKTIAGKSEKTTMDQLSHVIEHWKRDLKKGRRPRQSALQIACFDPAKDHTGQVLRGFPCLQQLGVIYDDTNSIAINAFYPTQYIFDRAYGNYLGLSHLGTFLAHSLKARFVQLNVFVGKPELGGTTKASLERLGDFAKSVCV